MKVDAARDGGGTDFSIVDACRIIVESLAVKCVSPESLLFLVSFDTNKMVWRGEYIWYLSLFI